MRAPASISIDDFSFVGLDCADLDGNGVDDLIVGDRAGSSSTVTPARVYSGLVLPSPPLPPPAPATGSADPGFLPPSPPALTTEENYVEGTEEDNEESKGALNSGELTATIICSVFGCLFLTVVCGLSARKRVLLRRRELSKQSGVVLESGGAVPSRVAADEWPAAAAVAKEAQVVAALALPGPEPASSLWFQQVKDMARKASEIVDEGLACGVEEILALDRPSRAERGNGLELAEDTTDLSVDLASPPRPQEPAMKLAERLSAGTSSTSLRSAPPPGQKKANGVVAGARKTCAPPPLGLPPGTTSVRHV